MIFILPDQNLGVFISYNSAGGGELVNQHLGFQRAFFDHYYPAPKVEPLQPPKDFASRAEQFVGSYKVTRSSYTTLEKVKNLMGSIEIKSPGDGTLLWITPWGEWHFVEVAPLYFLQVGGTSGITFRQDNQGRITKLFSDYTPMLTFEKMRWYETPGFNIGLVFVCIIIFLISVIVAGIRFIRKRINPSRNLPVKGAHAANWFILGISVLNLLFLAGTVLWGNPTPFFGVSLIYKIVLGLGVLSAALTIGALVSTVLAWKNKDWSIFTRVNYTLVTVAGVAFVWFLNNWNLLGWRF